MFTIKNAIKNIYRYKSKYMTFGVLYLIIILAASVCVSIFVRTNGVIDNLLKEIGGVSRFIEYRTTMERDFRMNTKEDFYILKDLKHVDDIKFFKYNFATHYWAYDEHGIADKKRALEVNLNIDGNVITLPDGEFLYNHDLNDERMPFKSVFVLGYNTSLLHLAADEFNLEKGRMFENDNEAVISVNRLSSSDADTWNKLDLGDTIVIKNDDGIYKEFTVVGIQAQNPDDEPNTNRRMIYTTLESAEYFKDISKGNRFLHNILPQNFDGRSSYYYYESNPQYQIWTDYDVLVYLDSYDSFQPVNKAMENHSEFEGLLAPLFPDFGDIRRLILNLQEWSIMFIMLIAFIIIFVTIVTTIILLNTRKYEIAVLRSAGMKKSRIILNYLVENLAFIWGISLISLIAAQFIAPIFTGRMFGDLQGLMSAESFANLSRGDFTLILQNAGLVFGGTTVIVMLSLLLACINIVRFEPLKIFNKQY